MSGLSQEAVCTASSVVSLYACWSLDVVANIRTVSPSYPLLTEILPAVDFVSKLSASLALAMMPFVCT